MSILGCNDDARSFKDSSLVPFMTLSLVKFNCFFTIAQISELDLFQKDQHLVSLIYIFGSIVTSLLSVYLGFCFTKIASLS